MKKSYNPISDGNNERNELTRRICRSLTEVLSHLDDVRGRSKTISGLFLPYLASLRIKLHDLCYKLILTDPLGYGKKGIDLLWKKGYHDVFTTAKRLRKGDTWSPEEAVLVQGLLISGLGHFQHLLFKLQSDYKVNVQGLIDFPLSISDLGLAKVKISQQKSPDKNLEEWAKDSCHKCLIYLGDLSRYLLDVFPLWNCGTAERYYLQATNLNINCGRPFNQLGTLAGIRNYNLDSVYYYMRCLIRPDSFEGAEANLRKALDKNSEFVQCDPILSNSSVSPLQKVVTKFLLIFDLWYFDKTFDYNIQDLCQDMLKEFQFCLNNESKNSHNNHNSHLSQQQQHQTDVNEMELLNLTPFKDSINWYPTSLNTDMILKIIILLMICIDKLQKRDSQNASVAIALCLEIFSQILQQLITNFEKFFSDFGIQKTIFDIQHSAGVKTEPQSKIDKPDKYKKKNKCDRDLGNDVRSNGYSQSVQTGKKCVKYSDKKKSKNATYLNNNNNNNLNANESNVDVEVSDLKVPDEGNNTGDESKEKVKRKSKLKRRKRVRPDSLCESELSDSDITLNDSTTENEYTSGESDSDELVSTDSEDLDETLLIIDQKIKEKKYKGNQANCVVNGVVVQNSVDQKEANNGRDGVRDNDKDIVMNNSSTDQNGHRTSNEKDKTKSLFTLLNGTEEPAKLNDNSGGDFSHEKSVSAAVELSKLNLKDGNEQGDSSNKEKKDLIISELSTKAIGVKELVQFVSQQDNLRAIKILCDWLSLHPDGLKLYIKNSKLLRGKIVTFLNLIKFQNETILKDFKNGENMNCNIPLSEDIITRGLTMLQKCQEKLDWDFHKANVLTNQEEVFLRLLKIIEFGHFLVKQDESGIIFNKEKDLFYVVGQNGMTNSVDMVNEKKLNNNTTRKGQLMKNMGQLWLKAEVRDLESRVQKKASNFSPYLVIDSEALIEHIILVKQLVGSRQFIVIIPTVVLSHLDECKRDSGRARETIRWLESQFQHGNRSLRAQKSQERFSLPLIKYPKKKDKEAWNFFQIVECCHYFSKQSEFQSCHSNLLVTLLTGQRDITFASDGRKEDVGKEYSAIGVAKNFGINLEHIEAFHTKWKLSTKSHG